MCLIPQFYLAYLTMELDSSLRLSIFWPDLGSLAGQREELELTRPVSKTGSFFVDNRNFFISFVHISMVLCAYNIITLETSLCSETIAFESEITEVFAVKEVKLFK